MGIFSSKKKALDPRNSDSYKQFIGAQDDFLRESEVTGLSKAGEAGQRNISRNITGAIQGNAGQGASRFDTMRDQVAASGGLDAGSLERVADANAFNTAQGSANIYGQGVNAQAQNTVGDLGQQQNFRNQVLMNRQGQMRDRFNLNAGIDANKQRFEQMQSQAKKDMFGNVVGIGATAFGGPAAGMAAKGLFSALA